MSGLPKTPDEWNDEDLRLRNRLYELTESDRQLRERLTNAEKERQDVLLQIRDLEAKAHERCDQLREELERAKTVLREVWESRERTEFQTAMRKSVESIIGSPLIAASEKESG